MTDLKELLERVKAATGPDRDIDDALMALAHFRDKRHIGATEGWEDDDDSFEPVKSDVWVDRATDRWVSTASHRFTDSVDDTLGLVRKMLPQDGWQWSAGDTNADNIPWACLTEPEGDCRDFVGSAPTVELAILAALLIALISEGSTPCPPNQDNVNSISLKPCPFCAAYLTRDGGSPLGDIWAHPVNGCAMQVAWFTATPEWVAKWNCRASDKPSEAVARLTPEEREKIKDAFETGLGRYTTTILPNEIARPLYSALFTHPEALSLPTERDGVTEEIAAERRRQREAEGWTPEHDDAHESGQMASAAACYASPEDFGSKEVPREWSDASRYMDASSVPMGRVTVPSAWPWDGEWWKPTDRRRDLIKAAALIVAEIERLDRAALTASIEGNRE